MQIHACLREWIHDHIQVYVRGRVGRWPGFPIIGHSSPGRRKGSCCVQRRYPSLVISTVTRCDHLKHTLSDLLANTRDTYGESSHAIWRVQFPTVRKKRVCVLKTITGWKVRKKGLLVELVLSAELIVRQTFSLDSDCPITAFSAISIVDLLIFQHQKMKKRTFKKWIKL